MDQKEKANAISKEIIGAAIQVHSELGPGLLETAYEACLSYELSTRKISHQLQVALPIKYQGISIEAGYRIDLLVGDLVIVEIKSVDSLAKIHEAQLMTYLKLTNKWLGLLINFNVILLKNGIRRMVLG